MTTRGHWVHELAMQRGISVKTVEKTLESAAGTVADATLDHVRGMQDESLRLFLIGETLASMWAGQAMWEAAASVAYFVNDELPLLRDGKRQAGTKAPRRIEVQAEVERLVRNLPGSTVAELWAAASSDVTDRIGLHAFKRRVTKARAARSK